MKLFPYQQQSLEAVAAAHREVKRVCYVLPTGGGKSVVATEWARRQSEVSPRGLVLAHRIELLRQMQVHLRRAGIDAGIISPEEPAQPWLPVQCASLDTIVARGEVPDADWAIADECHHLPADTYQPVLDALPEAITLGLTATPQRGDGRPLEMFQRLVVGAQYSDLIKLGRICPVKIFRPAEYLGSDFATEPADAWIKHADGQRGFAFCRSVKAARELATELKKRGVRAACVEGRMSESARSKAINDFREGLIDCLTNVHILTEGVDIPEAVVCMLASSPRHVCTFLQRVGRVLRAFPGKRHAVLIDLPGCSHPDMHSAPTSDREYALEGRAIKAVGESLKNCPKCALTVPSACRVCECGFEWPRREYKGPKIWNVELLEFFESGGEIAEAPKDLKRKEWERLVGVCMSKSFGLSFAVKEYRRQFEEDPPKALLKTIDDAERVRELRRLLSIQQSRGLKLGWISHAYKQTFGAFPSRALREAAGVPLPSAQYG